MYILFIESQDILSNINLNILRIDRDLDTLEIYTNKYKFLVSFVIFKRKLNKNCPKYYPKILGARVKNQFSKIVFRSSIPSPLFAEAASISPFIPFCSIKCIDSLI